MSHSITPRTGAIVWQDLTVPDAQSIRDFYCAVVGWTATPHAMGEYEDYDIHPTEGQETIAGICHARGDNAHVPAQWLLYIAVADVEASAQRCVERGGRVVDGPRMMG